MKRRYVILLTACVNPGGMPFTVLTDSSERLRQYRAALDFYLRETSYPIVFCENTLCDFSDDYKQYIKTGRLEYITFDGNSFDKSRGKGYGEAIIMAEAFSRSRLMMSCDYLIKITGRLVVKNISALIKDNNRMITSTIQTFHPNNNMIDSRVFILPRRFVTDVFLPSKKHINDTNGVFFEHVLFNTIISRQSFVYIPFLKVPLIEGMSGSKGNKYTPVPADNNRFAFDMIGNALRIDKKMCSYRMPVVIKVLLFLSRCLLYLRK